MDDKKLTSSINILVEALRGGIARRQKIAEFQRMVWEERVDASDPVFSVLKELAYDLDFYEASPRSRREDPTFFGDERFEAEVAAAFRKLREAGVDVPDVNTGAR